MMYQIEFIRFIDGRSDPEIIERINGEFPTLQAAIDKGVTIFGTVQATRNAQGFQIVENGARIVARRFRGDM